MDNLPLAGEGPHLSVRAVAGGHVHVGVVLGVVAVAGHVETEVGQGAVDPRRGPGRVLRGGRRRRLGGVNLLTQQRVDLVLQTVASTARVTVPGSLQRNRTGNSWASSLEYLH